MAAGSESVDNKDKMDTKPEMEVIELPRDVLAAYFLIHETGKWDKFDCCGKFGILISLIFPFFIQTYTLVMLLTLETEPLNDISFDTDFYQNAITLAVLFLYLWKDVIGYWNSLWFYMRIVDKKKAKLKELSKQTGMESSIDSKTELITDDNNKNIIDSKEVIIDDNKEDVSLIKYAKGAGKAANKFGKQALKVTKDIGSTVGKGAIYAIDTAHFLSIRILILYVFILYAGFAFYSISAMSQSQSFSEKLEVILSIFFVLEIDDWSFDLFILSNNILDDDEFNVEIQQKHFYSNETDEYKSKKRNLIYSESFVIVSVIIAFVVTILW